MARNLLAGRGFYLYDGAVYLGWPPLYPLTLAALGVTGLDLLAAARILNALLFGVLVWLAYAQARVITSSIVLAMSAALLVLCSISLSASYGGQPTARCYSSRSVRLPF
ncbi:MAG: hypothetical protein ABR543_07445 [Gemmatimonadaceae bacterium]